LLYDLRWWLLWTWPGRAAAAVTGLLLTAVGAVVGGWLLFGPDRFEPLDLDGPIPSAGPAGGRAVLSGPSDGAAADIGPDVDAGGDEDQVPGPPAPEEVAPDDEPVVRSAGPTVWLLFSTGTGELTGDEADWMRMPDGTRRAHDRLTDTIMLAVTDPDGGHSALLSIPRDTWLFDRGYRVNAVYARDGIQALVDDIRDLTGLPVHHVVGVNMRGFTRTVEAAGGVVVATDRPLRDRNSHLRELPAGCWQLEGPDALAYVRSRYTETKVDGRWQYDRSASDFGRAGRQQEVLASLWGQLRRQPLSTVVPQLLQVAADDVTFDRGTGPDDLLAVAKTAAAVAGGEVETYTLPTSGRQIGRAAAQVVDADAAAPVLERLRQWPPAAAGVTSRQPADDVRGDGGDTGRPPGGPPRLDPASCQPSPVPWMAP